MKTVAKKIKLSLFVKLIAIVFSLITVTFSWFVFSKDGWINPFDVNVVGTISVTISQDGFEWSNKLEINKDSDDYGRFTEFSGNGDKMYIPIISNHTITGFYKPDYSNREKDYIEIDTLIKTDGPISFYLDGDSYILPSSDSEFKDNIAGAVRVAFIVENSRPVIWAPNSLYEYVDDKTVKHGNVATVEEEYKYVYKDNNDTFIDTNNYEVIKTNGSVNGYVNGTVDNSYKCFMWGDLNEINNYTDNVKPIFKVSSVGSEQVIIPMKIVVWVEGEDREAQASLIGGKIKMHLKFTTKAA